MQAGFYGSLTRVLEENDRVSTSLLAPGSLLVSHIKREIDRVVSSGVLRRFPVLWLTDWGWAVQMLELYTPMLGCR